MFGFGIILMHLSDYFTRRKYVKRKKEELKDKDVEGRRPTNA
jgi:hypothetical protein